MAILKHNNACGVAVRDTLIEAGKDALAGDPISAFGGVVITNQKIDHETAQEIDKLFYEVLIAPDFDQEALDLLKKKPKRILMRRKPCSLPKWQVRTALNGTLVQQKDMTIAKADQWKVVTEKQPSKAEMDDLAFANILVKHTKSNTIVLAKNKQLVGSGTGQTSRVDALKQAITKANSFGFDLRGAVMASDAFFPFADSVEIAGNAGINSVIQPGGSIKDQDSVDFCNKNNMSMIMTGIRHFKH
jgi:phosphoribosylaminoimidazolecarboxamide formyltransferase/IMP cyclohydrolase